MSNAEVINLILMHADSFIAIKEGITEDQATEVRNFANYLVGMMELNNEPSN